ncbi:hypothetical protein HII31_08432 [Pseudocercospora fuligena]|uniref:Uncharacterized protein n=1 Tax=Pseudocercospora fuligena TaxID=685502 RepID=A0A8H6RHF1_9PEZI|nr:hypothetical protein HII31_08432 [Pseudocercospora fuligena]
MGAMHQSTQVRRLDKIHASRQHDYRAGSAAALEHSSRSVTQHCLIVVPIHLNGHPKLFRCDSLCPPGRSSCALPNPRRFEFSTEEPVRNAGACPGRLVTGRVITSSPKVFCISPDSDERQLTHDLMSLITI